MKKLILLVIMLTNLILVNAQTDTVMYLAEMETVNIICFDQHERAIIYAPNGCNTINWRINYSQLSTDNPIIIDGNLSGAYAIQFQGANCGQYSCLLYFAQLDIPDTTTELWKHQHNPIELSIGSLPELPAFYPPDQHYELLWSTGETSETIEVFEPGTYTCSISAMCATSMQTFIVKDNVEVYRATVDLATGLNKVTWQTTPEQAEYISEVKVERDGFVVGTAPYEDGQFMDYIGSENAARNYRLTGITTEGDECPIPSYQLGTLHVDFSPNASNPNKLNMAWTAPYIEEGMPLVVSYFQICKYDPVTGEVTVIDQIGANSTIASYDVNLFNGGYATVAALFSEGRNYEEMSFSNLTEEILGVGENDGNQVRIYPNPAHGILYVETRRATSLPAETEYRITNLMGQTLMSGIVETCHGASLQRINIENLPQGMYFVVIGGVTRKFVVE